MKLQTGLRMLRYFCSISVVMAALFAHTPAQADIAAGKYGVNQVFDVQWNCSVPSLGGTCDYAPHPTEAVQFMTSFFAQPYSDTGQYDIGTGYIQFVATGGNGPHGTPSYKIVLYSNAGGWVRDINDGGEFYALSPTGIFYVSTTNQNGTVVTNSAAYTYGSSLTFTNNPALWPPSSYPATATVITPASKVVPTINEWGMILFMLIAGIGSVYYIRKSARVL